MLVQTVYGTLFPLVEVSRSGFYVVLLNGKHFNMPRRNVRMLVKEKVKS